MRAHALLLAAGLALSAPASAEEAGAAKTGNPLTPGKESYPACAAQIKQYCGLIVPGEGRVAECLRAGGEDRLSPRCLKSLPKGDPKKVRPANPWSAACGGDIKKLCKGMPPDMSVRECLEMNWDKVSDRCRDFASGNQGRPQSDVKDERPAPKR